MPFPANKNVIRDVDGNIGVPDPTKPQHAANKAYVDAHAGGGGGGGAKWLSGTGVPAAGLGTLGDWYFDIATDRVYEKTGPTVWTFRSDLTGSPGATGPAGPTGAAGAAGAPGAPGAAGAGVPAGGATGTLLTKNSAADNDTKWAPAPVSLPPQTGHATQFLTTDGTAATWDNTAVIDSTDSGVLVVASQGSAAPAGSVAMPVGSVITYAGVAAPAGWLLCDGTAISRTTYAGLFAVLSTTYGAGDGSTTFNLPSLKGRVPVGLDAAQTEFSFLGQQSGTKTETLTVAQMPSHTHVQDAHQHSAISTAGSGGPATVAGWTVGGASGSQNTTFAYTGATTPTNQNTGGGGSHNNLQPYVVFNYIVKT